MERCDHCGKQLTDEDVTMLSVGLLGSRRYFHRRCASTVKAKHRRRAAIIALVTVGITALVVLAIFVVDQTGDAAWHAGLVLILALAIGGWGTLSEASAYRGLSDGGKISR